MTAPAKPIGEFVCRVRENTWVNPEYKHLVLEAPAAALGVGPGQFFHLLCPATATEAPFLRRPMSVYRSDQAAGRLEFLYKVVGAGTRVMAALEPGDDFEVLGPLGHGFEIDPTWRRIVIVARGVGLATLAPLVTAAKAASIGVSAILSARSPELLMSADSMAADGADVVTLTDAEGSSDPAEVEDLVRSLVVTTPIDAFATCGSNRLLALLQRLGAEYDIPGQVALEQTMGCGLGMCFCCVRRVRTPDGEVYKRVCWEGPVFDLQEVIVP
ncbi:MAG: dihydroorotate dehydrogenase electron transfer subunit [Alphaproteobacteria bacterium]|nr:dihydroorotate dehydrogenase electron transfer subunit [Alphaproteobacteria bacterium]MDP6624250.1 dihydroorotate dehydrogenase electron transfer subunit [Alphaproteobacteria bacterium]